MSSSIRTQQDRPRVLVAGGGVAALEACLFLRAYVTENDVAIDLLAPNRVFSYRPLSVLESFGGARAWSMPLERFAADEDVTLVHDALGAVLGPERAIVTTSGVRCRYDRLLVAIGARATPQLRGAITRLRIRRRHAGRARVRRWRGRNRRSGRARCGTPVLTRCGWRRGCAAARRGAPARWRRPHRRRRPARGARRVAAAAR